MKEPESESDSGGALLGRAEKGEVAGCRRGRWSRRNAFRARYRSLSRTVMFVGSQRGGEIRSVCASSSEKPHPPGPCGQDSACM